MLFVNFLYALALLAIGIWGFSAADDPGQIRALALPALTFGGAVLFCALFSLKEPRHGMAGASFLGFLACLTSAGPLLGRLTRGEFDPAHPAHRLGAALCLLSALYLAIAFTAWKRARRRRAIAALEGGP